MIAHPTPPAVQAAPRYRAPLGAGVEQIDTPALLLDRDRLERNIAAMAAFVAGGPAKLRPHSKTHKCVEIARLQLATGAVGITCAKVGEAEALAAGGIPDILIANEVVGPVKIARLVALARHCALTVAVDDAGNVAELSAAATAAGVTLRCYVEVDIGMGRCGVADGAAALALARLVAAAARAGLRRAADLRGPPAGARAVRGAGRARPPRHGASAGRQSRPSRPAAWRSVR